MSPKGNADRARLWPALRALVEAALGAAEDHARALEAFVDAWLEAVTEGKPDPARQIAEFMFLHLAPQEGIYIRHTVRQDLWQEAVGHRFPIQPPWRPPIAPTCAYCGRLGGPPGPPDDRKNGGRG